MYTTFMNEAENQKWYKSNFAIIGFLVVFFPVGLFLMWKYAKWNNKVKWVITGVLILLILANKSSSNTKESGIKPQFVQETTSTPIPTVKSPEYDIIYETSKVRFDGGKNYYVLTQPFNLESDAFKEDIKSIFKKIVSEKGNKVSIEIYDNKDTLELFYKRYGDLSLNRPLTKVEVESNASHLIASYDGDLTTGVYKNTLSFFPSGVKTSPLIGKYVDTIEFNADK